MKFFKITTIEIQAGRNSMVTTPDIITKKVRDVLAISDKLSYHQDYGDLTDKVIKIKGSTIKDKTFYRYPNLSLPRNKVDLLKEKYNISVTRNKAAAETNSKMLIPAARASGVSTGACIISSPPSI